MKRGNDGREREMRICGTGCEYMECIIANRVTRLSSPFNLVAVNVLQANSCLFKSRPAQPPRAWEVQLHLIFNK